jgi:hypothetical protein
MRPKNRRNEYTSSGKQQRSSNVEMDDQQTCLWSASPALPLFMTERMALGPSVVQGAA